MLGVCGATSALASDHVDGHEASRDRGADLTDLYAWTPAPGRVAVALAWTPLARKRARPSRDRTFSIRLRRADGHGVAAKELAITCTGERRARRDDRLACRIAADPVTVPWNGVASVGSMRLFAGVRRDPFFIALGRVDDEVPTEGRRRGVRGVDFLHNAFVRGRVRALVVELDARDVPGERPYLAVVAESWTAGERIDRLGRPEIANFILAPKFGRPHLPRDVRGAWNTEDGFTAAPGHLSAYEVAMSEGLARLDARDGQVDWPVPHPLAERLLQDWLIVDPTRDCGVSDPSFLEIEAAWLAGLPHQTCGGRTPNDDVVDRLLTWGINGPTRVPPGPPLYGSPSIPAPHRSDGVDRPGAPASSLFPYLRDP